MNELARSAGIGAAKRGIHVALAFSALGVAILLYAVMFHGAHGILYLEGLAFSVYGMVATLLEIVARLAQRTRVFNRYTEFRNAFLWEAHMLLLTFTHFITYRLLE